MIAMHTILPDRTFDVFIQRATQGLVAVVTHQLMIEPPLHRAMARQFCRLRTGPAFAYGSTRSHAICKISRPT